MYRANSSTVLSGKVEENCYITHFSSSGQRQGECDENEIQEFFYRNYK